MTADLTAVPPGKIAAVVTCLEMSAPPTLRPEKALVDAQLVAVSVPALDWYRGLYRRVGQHWLWFSRLALPDASLRVILADPQVSIYAVRLGADDIGLLELDARTAGEVELAFFGLAPDFTGQGLGRWLMNHALKLAWAPKPQRVWVHTCTLDDPRALDFYMRSGFRPYARQIEIADDPRILGLLPRDVAPHVPLIGDPV